LPKKGIRFIVSDMRSAAIAILLFALAPSAAHAHPHMFIESFLEFEFDSAECTGVWVDWGFDSCFSASIIYDYDRNRDGRFDQRETAAIFNEAFINLEKYGFFLYFRRGSNSSLPAAVDHFSARQEKGRLFYRFHVPVKGMGLTGHFSVSVFDPTYFCAVAYRDPPAGLYIPPAGSSTSSGSAAGRRVSANRADKPNRVRGAPHPSRTAQTERVKQRRTVPGTYT